MSVLAWSILLLALLCVIGLDWIPKVLNARAQGVNMARWRVVLVVVIIICLANFVIFDIIASYLGGDALNGYVQNGRFYLRSHGQITEVSRSVFTYSLWHARSLFITHPLGAIAMGTLLASRKKWRRHL